MNTDTELDPALVARLRSALDEVAATPLSATPASPPAAVAGTARLAAGHRERWSTGRWTAVAASVVLVAGAVAIIATNLSNRRPVESSATTTQSPATTGLPGADTSMHYFLAAADLAPGAVVNEPVCCLQPLEVAMAWARDGNPADGLLVMIAGPTDPEVSPVTTPTATVITIGDTSMSIDSYGITADERDALAATLTPGSGLPWVLPAEGWAPIALQSPHDSPARTQVFGGQVALTAGVGADTFFGFAAATDVRSTTVAGNPGWVLSGSDSTMVVWRHPQSGEWMRLTVPTALADRTDALVAAIGPTDDDGSTTVTVPTPDIQGGRRVDVTAVTGQPLPTYGSPSSLDPAVGLPAPAFTTSAGEFTVDGPTLLLFAAHWCPHCNAELPRVIEAIAAGDLDGVRVVVVSTAEASKGANFPPEAWLPAMGWTGEALMDISPGDGNPGQLATAFGAPGWPYYVVLDGDGLVAARASGEMTTAALVALVATAG